MTALPDDSWLLSIRPQLARMTAEDYRALPQEICRAIEVVDGYVAYSEAPSPAHQTAARRLANLMEGFARAAMSSGHECLTVNTDVDLRLRDLPLLNRRPDLALYRCLADGEQLRAQHALLVAEIVSPGSETTDTVDKFGEYAKAGIGHYWLIRLDRTGVSAIERYQLDRATDSYRHVGTLMKEEPGDPPALASPIPMTVDWRALAY